MEVSRELETDACLVLVRSCGAVQGADSLLGSLSKGTALVLWSGQDLLPLPTLVSGFLR